MSEDRIYKVYILEFPNGKVYIGMTKQTLDSRCKNGKSYTRNKVMFDDIINYGWNNINKKILFDNLTQEEACALEMKSISQYNSTHTEKGYNITKGGKGVIGYNYTEKDRLKMSLSHIGKIIPEEQRRKISNARKGKPTWNTGIKTKPCSEETKEKIRQSLLGKKHTEERRKNISKAVLMRIREKKA